MAKIKVLAFLPVLLALTAMLLAGPATAQRNAAEPEHCGDSGVWIQVLGSGATELRDGRAGPSYLVWVDGRARVLVNTGAGSALRFGEANADFADLEAVAFTQLRPDHVSDLPAFLHATLDDEREERLIILGPEGSDDWPALELVIERLMSEEGAFPQLRGYLDPTGPTSFYITLREVMAIGNRRWSGFSTENVALSAMPVHHGDVPALAWRIDAGERSITIAGSFSNRNDRVADFAEGTNALIIHHAIPEQARGPVRDYHVRPSQIARIARRSGTELLMLTYRTQRTRGYQVQTLDIIEEEFDGALRLADDTQCLGLGSR